MTRYCGGDQTREREREGGGSERERERERERRMPATELRRLVSGILLVLVYYKIAYYRWGRRHSPPMMSCIRVWPSTVLRIQSSYHHGLSSQGWGGIRTHATHAQCPHLRYTAHDEIHTSCSMFRDSSERDERSDGAYSPALGLTTKHWAEVASAVASHKRSGWH